MVSLQIQPNIKIIINEPKNVTTSTKIDTKTEENDQKYKPIQPLQPFNPPKYYCLIISKSEYDKLNTELDHIQRIRRRHREAHLTKTTKHKPSITPVIMNKIIPIPTGDTPVSISVDKLNFDKKTLDWTRNQIAGFTIWPSS